MFPTVKFFSVSLLLLCLAVVPFAEAQQDMTKQEESKTSFRLIAASQVIAIHFETIAAANNYWCDGN